MPSITILLKLLSILNIQFLNQIFQEKIFSLSPSPKYRIIIPADSTEASNITTSLNQDKSDGPNSIPNKIVKLLNKDISDQLLILSNQAFSSVIFNYRPVFIYRQISLLSNKILEALMYNRFYNFLEKKKKFYFHPYSVFDRNILPLML